MQCVSFLRFYSDGTKGNITLLRHTGHFMKRLIGLTETITGFTGYKKKRRHIRRRSYNKEKNLRLYLIKDIEVMLIKHNTQYVPEGINNRCSYECIFTAAVIRYRLVRRGAQCY